MNAKNTKYDDLTSIKGIGQSRPEWLKNMLGVRTYQNLAALSPEKILSQLKSDGMIASQGEVERWIDQARELAGQKGNSSPDDWEPFASFVVEFQSRRGKTEARELCTTIQYMEADKEEMWPGIETERLCHWMRERVNKEVSATGDQFRYREDAHETGMKQTITPSRKLPSVVVSQVEAFQPPQGVKPSAVSTPGKPFQGFIRSGKLFDLQVSFSIIGLDPGNFQYGKILYVAQFYARELPLGKWIHLGDSDPQTLIEGADKYTAILSGIALPAGMYFLNLLIDIQSKPPLFNYHGVPLLQVY